MLIPSLGHNGQGRWENPTKDEIINILEAYGSSKVGKVTARVGILVIFVQT